VPLISHGLQKGGDCGRDFVRTNLLNGHDTDDLEGVAKTWGGSLAWPGLIGLADA